LTIIIGVVHRGNLRIFTHCTRVTTNIFILLGSLIFLNSCTQLSNEEQILSLSSRVSTINNTNANDNIDPDVVSKNLYSNKCAICHNAIEVSNLKGRIITAQTIDSAINYNISAMKILQGQLSSDQLDRISKLFATTTNGSQVTSSFVCQSGKDESKFSSELIRLTGTELRNTYKTILNSSLWSSLSAYYYLIPEDNFQGNIVNFVPKFNADNLDQISRFNEILASKLVVNSVFVSDFFGSCATASSFTKACFDTFLSSKGQYILRGQLSADDNPNFWNVLSQASSLEDKYKTLVQILLNDPRFLFHIELGDGSVSVNGLQMLTSYEIANRLSFSILASPPDAMLWSDATADKLKVFSNVVAHVDRLINSSEFKNRIVDFIKFYVGLSLASNAPNHSEFLNGLSSNQLDTDATAEFNNYVKYVVFTKRGTLIDLMTSQYAFPTTANLASVFKTSVVSSVETPVIASNHFGLLSRPYMNLVSTPQLKLVQRGRRIRVNMLCSDVPQPSASDLAARPVMADTDLVTLNRRQYIDKATMGAASCIVCHSKMNQLGFATENYDSVGRFITSQKIYNSNDVKVATFPSTSLSTPKFTEIDNRTFNNFLEFETELSKSDTLHQCLSRKIFHFFQRKSEDLTYDSCRLNKIDNLIKKNMPFLDFVIENFKQPSIMYKRSSL